MLREVLRSLLRCALPLDEADLVRLLEWPVRATNPITGHLYPLSGMAAAAENFAAANEVGPGLRAALETLVQLIRREMARLKAAGMSARKDCLQVADRLQALAAGPRLDLQPGEAWADAALADLQAMTGGQREAWNALLMYCQAGGTGKLTERWKEGARPLLDRVGFEAFKEHLLRWFPRVDDPRAQPLARRFAWEPDPNHILEGPHVALLRGLAWCAGLKSDTELAGALGQLALSAYRKLPGKGPRLAALGNACVAALAMMPGREAVGPLDELKAKVPSSAAQKEIQKALDAVAAR